MTEELKESFGKFQDKFQEFLLYEDVDSERVIDWNYVSKFAKEIAPQDRIPELKREVLEAEYAKKMHRISPYISNYTKLKINESPWAQATYPIEWIDFNIDNFRLQFEIWEQHQEKIMAEKYGDIPYFEREMSTKMNSSITGAMIGYLSGIVLGQYDPGIFGRQTLKRRLYFVDTTMTEMANQLNLDIDEFRTWIAIHEYTHDYEFENQLSKGWLRNWFNTEMKKSQRHLLDHKAMIKEAHMREIIKIQERQNSMKTFNTMMKKQINSLNRIQPAMCVIEGYSDFLMDRIGSQILPNYEQIKKKFSESRKKRERSKGISEQLMEQFMGLEKKRQQYVLGESFVRTVVEKEGIEFMNKFYESEENVPTMEEIKNAILWIQRIKK